MKFKKYDIYKITGNPETQTARELIKNKQAVFKISIIKHPINKKVYYLNPETQEQQQYINFKKYGLKQDQNEIIYIRSNIKVKDYYIKYLTINFKRTNKKFIVHQYLI